MKLVTKGLLGAVALFGSLSASAAPLIDGGFEAQGAAAAGSSYCYFGMAIACSPSTPWSGSLGGGLQNEANSSWPGAPTSDGSYYGFIQGAGSTLSQVFSVGATTTYGLSWLAAGRPSGGSVDGNQRYSVTLTGGNGTQTLFTGSTTSFQPFGLQNSGSFVLTPGTYTLSFNGLAVGDHTAFIDAVSLTSAVPEAATWAMMLLGFGVIGGALRRHRNVAARVRFA
jgi:hypothetical protein